MRSFPSLNTIPVGTHCFVDRFFDTHCYRHDHQANTIITGECQKGGISFCTEAAKEAANSATRPNLLLGDLVQNLQYLGLIRTSDGLAVVPIHRLPVC